MIERLRTIESELILIGLIILAAALIRVWAIDYDLPYIYHSDEPLNVGVIQNIFRNGDLNPHFFTYPSLFFYINSLAYIPFFLVGKLMDIFQTPADILPPISQTMGVTLAQMPEAVLLNRLITVLFDVGTVVLTFPIGRRLQGKSLTGLLAALMVAFGPTNVLLSQTVTPDPFLTFFATAAFLAALLVYQSGRTRHYIVAGALVGMTASSKYNGGLIFIALLAAHFFRHGLAGFRNRNLYLAIAVAGLAFLATTPYSVLDYSNFWNDLQFDIQHYRAGHIGMEGDPLLFYLNYGWITLGPISFLAMLEVARGLFTRTKEIILPSIFPATYFIFISSVATRNDRTFLQLTPFICLLAASFLVFLIQRITNIQPGTVRRLAIGAVIALLVASIVWPVSRSVASIIHRTEPDSRELSRLWIANNVPSGSQIAVEPYSPYVDPIRFNVQGVRRIIEHGPDWYVENGFDYLVFSTRYFMRFYRGADRYASQVNQYNRFFDRFRLVERIYDRTDEVLIFAVK